MGAVDFSIDPKLVSILQQQLPLSIFVETGTFEGETIQRMRPFFQKIYSSELSDKHFRKASERFKGADSVYLFHEESVKFLKDLRPALKDASVLYWLDAHWFAGDETEGIHCQCPLLDELNEISGLNSRSVLLIDDARLFLSPPSLPHDMSQWPTFDSIVRQLWGLSPTHQVMVLNDMILYFPQHIRDAVNKYAQDYSVDWLSVFDKSRHYDALLLQLKEKDQAIQEKESQILFLTKTSREKEAQIQSLAKVLKERDDILEQKEAQVKILSDKSRHYGSLLLQLKEKDQAIQEKESQILHLASASREREAQIQSLAKALQEREDILQQKEAQVRSLSDKARDYDLLLLQLKEKDQAIQEKESQILLLASASREKEAQIQSLAKAVKEREEILQQQETQVRILSEDHEKVTAVAEERNVALQEKEAQIQLLSQAIKQRDRALQAKEAQIKLLDEVTRERDGELKIKESQIQLLASLSKRGKEAAFESLPELEGERESEKPR